MFSTFLRLLRFYVDILRQGSTRTRLAIWPFLKRVLTGLERTFVGFGMRRKLSNLRQGISFNDKPNTRLSSSDISISSSMVVHCASKVPKSLLPYTLTDVVEPDAGATDPSVAIATVKEEEEEAKPTTGLLKTTPCSSLRYQRKSIVPTCQLSFNPEQTLGRLHYAGSLLGYLQCESPALSYFDDWQPYVHPEGQIYYYHTSHHAITEANLQNRNTLCKINNWLKEFHQAREHLYFELPPAYEVLLELDLEEEGCRYYLIDHERQTLFYLDDANNDHLDLPEVCSTTHLGIWLEEQYWIHLEYFPMHRALPPSVQPTMMAMLTHAWGDQSTSSLSTAPYSAEQCKEFVLMIEKFTGLPEQEGYKTCIIARLMNEFVHSRFINLYGQPEGARLARNQSTLPQSDSSDSRLFRVLSTVSFRQPHKELEELNSLWVDSIVYTEHWRNFVTTRVQEWRGVSLMSAILLPVDLMIVVHCHAQSISGASGWISHLSGVNTSCIAATMSLLLSMSALIVGVATILVHQPLCKSHASDANAYLQSASHETLGLQPLAIVLSIPRTLLIWALAITGAALLAFSLQLLDVWGLSIVGTLVFVLSALLFWAIRFFHTRETLYDSVASLPVGGFLANVRGLFRGKKVEQESA
ncbi:hypothetical protein K439DRAFT_1638397 [Ramaria rubella]|nr:hypothetical protein K439DRAFT_1638397 [Ramaria rubella]